MIPGCQRDAVPGVERLAGMAVGLVNQARLSGCEGEEAVKPAGAWMVFEVSV